MKRAVTVCLLMLLCCCIAQAEPVGEYNYDYICRYTAPNGQDLYFISSREDPNVYLEDVNLDGAQDVVVQTIDGATNAFFEFFVWDGEKYVLAEHPQMEYGICNYVLDARGYVMAHGHNGMAGALFEDYLYRWEGTNLRPVRGLVSAEKEETTWQGNTFTTVVWTDILHLSFYDYTAEYNPIWEADTTAEEMFEEGGLYDQMAALFWQGL